MRRAAIGMSAGRAARGRLWPAWLALLLLACGPAVSQDAARLSDEALVQALRAGGYNVYFRHAATDWSAGDRVREPGDWTSCDAGRMRQLSDEGRRASRKVGEAIRALGIPVARVLASPYCRTVETAELMELGPVEPTTDVMNLRAADYVGGEDAVVERARARLATPPEPGTNTVIVAHGNLARAATRVYPGEGEALVFRPEGDAFAFVGRLTPARFAQLAEALAD